MTARFRIALLSSTANRGGFRCGTHALDVYLARQAGQDVRRGVAKCYVLLEDGNRIAGYYTLSASSIVLNDLPRVTRRKLPCYPLVPAAHLGRLAVDEREQGRGLGSTLLADALTRAAEAALAVFAMVVDAKDDRATAFYRHFGFIPFTEKPHTLFLPMRTARQAMSDTH